MILFVVAAGKSVVCLIVGVVGRRGLVVSPHKYQPKISPPYRLRYTHVMARNFRDTPYIYIYIYLYIHIYT
jgi:hypothetical protein